MRANRWQTLLKAEKLIPALDVFWANMTGYLGNSILPARAGEIIRSVYIARENKLSLSFVLSTGFVERLIDLIALVILGSISLTYAGIVSTQLETAIKVMTIVAAIGFFIILIIPYLGREMVNIISSLTAINSSGREKIAGFLEQFLRGVEALHNPGRAGVFILYTCLIWGMDGFGTIILGHALHLKITITQSFLLIAGLGLSSAIPSTPGYVGIYQFVAVIVLEPFGISNANALALIIFLQVMNLITVSIWGWAGFSRASVFLSPKHETDP
jgi:uncharacterized protein (TIRG00374 family)